VNLEVFRLAAVKTECVNSDTTDVAFISEELCKFGRVARKMHAILVSFLVIISD
jgi:hypothetical protein